VKKINFYSTILLLGFLLGITINVSSQTTIWSENFSAYVEGTGIDGTGNIGDYPANVTKWTLDVSEATLTDADDYIKTHNYKLESRDLDGPTIWLSENIDISTYSSVIFSLDASEDGTMEESDYFDVYYKVDAGDFTLIPNWNSLGSVDHTLIDDFTSTTVTQTINSGSTLVIKVIMNNNTSTEYLKLDNVFVKANMEYVSSTTTQNTRNIAAGKTNRQIIGIEVVTTGTESPISITQFTINANGSSTPVSTNIENAKIYCTGTSNAFATGTQFGSTYASPTTTNFNITGTQQLSEGTNYFWLTFDTKTGATLGELIDAECISFVIGGTTEIPTITDPAGSRTISAPLSGSYTIGAKSNYASFTAAANDLNDLGISGTVSFAVASGTYTEQISLSAIDGTSATDTIVFQSSTSDPADVTLQYTPTSTANYVVSFDGSDYISFLDMTIQTTGTSSYGRVFVFSGATQSITLKGNNIQGMDISSDDDVYAVIYASSGASNMANNINIENDTITNGSHGIYFMGDNNTNLETQNTFINNVLNNFYHTGINAECQDAVIINKNTLTGKASNASANGIIANECNNAMEITQNKVFLNATNENSGISLYTCIGTSSNQGLTANNYISFEEATVTTEGIYLMSCGYQKIYHNSINIRASSKNNGGNRTGNQTGIGIDYWWAQSIFGYLKIMNNIARTAAVEVIKVSQIAVDEGYVENSDYNDYYTDWTTLGTWGGTGCADLAAWQTASNDDWNSVTVDPGFVSSTVSDVTEPTLGESVSKLPEVPKDNRNSRREDNTTPGATILTNRWLGNTHLWDDPNNWSLGVVPNENHNVVIVGEYNSGVNYPILDGDANCHSLNLESGTMALNGHKINVKGNLNIGDGNAYGGTINLNGPGSQYQFLDTEDSGNRFKLTDVDISFYNNSMCKTTADMEVKSITTNVGSTFDLDGNDAVISENGFFSDGNLANDNKISFTGSSNSTVEFNDSYRYNHVEIDKDLSTVEVTVTPRGKTYKFKDFSVINGKVVATGNEVDIAGNADYTGGELNTDKITYTGSTNSTVTPGDERQDNVVVNKDSHGIELQITPTGKKYKIKALTLERGTLNAAGSEFDFSGNTDLTGGDFSADRVTFSGATNSQVSTGNNIMQEMIVDKDGNAVVDLQDALVAAVLKILKGKLEANNNIDISGKLTIGETGNAANVNVKPGKCLIVTDSIIINDGGELKIKSDIGGGGHVIPKGKIKKTGTGKITVEQYVTDGQWHLVSSPVANATVNSLYFNGNPDVWLTEHNEPDNSWEYITSLTTPMPFGKGFGYWVGTSKTDVTALFEGDLLTDNLTLNSGSTPPLAFSNIDHGFNLVGNPYSCALDWDIGTWELTNLEGSVWVWQDAGNGTGNYLVRNLAGEGSLTDGIIPMCQGFFVHATTSVPVFTIPTDARVHSTQPYYKDGEREVAPHIILNVNNSENQDGVWIGFDENMTTGFDYGRDVTKFFGSTDVPQLYLSEQDYQLSIDILPSLTGEEQIVAMSFIASTEEIYKISASSLEYLPETDVTLEDLKTGIFQKLNDNPEYSFTGTPEDDPERFLVHFYNLPIGIDYPNINENNKEINIYAYDKTVYIKCKGETINHTGIVSIYDMYGRLILNKNLLPRSINKIHVPVSNNLLIVKVIKGNKMFTDKVFIK